MRLLLFFSTLVFCSLACEKAPISDFNEQNIVTELQLTFVDIDSVAPTVVHKYQDLDGPEGKEPVFSSSGILIPLVSYFVSATLIDQQQDITESIKAQGTDYQIFYELLGLNGAFNYRDVDSNNKPIGLLSVAGFQAANEGDLRFTMRYKPKKSNPKVAEGVVQNAGGTTQIDIYFPFQVQ